MTDWQLVLLTAFVTTLGTGLVTYVGHRLTVSKDTKDEHDRDARYLAIRVVCILDRFIAGCSEVVADSGESDAEGYRHTTAKYPDLQFPDDVDWRSIAPKLMYRILALPNDLDSAHKSIQYMADVVATPPDYEEIFEERNYQFGKLGLAALALADEIRETFEIPLHNYGPGWHPKPWFERATVEIDRMRKEGAESAANLIRAHNEKVARGEAVNLAPMPNVMPERQ
ncbi:hypothetical protein [Mesorhizobium sp. M0816]|uniref:hypothetical protein n=1 Tax=Mesorhizobium sp. M0816 TaxID=2957006 RepID=UPI00333CD83A